MFDRVLNISRLWICLRFWICQASEGSHSLKEHKAAFMTKQSLIFFLVDGSIWFSFGGFPTNTPHGFHVKTTWKRPFPRRFNVESMGCVCRVMGAGAVNLDITAMKSWTTTKQWNQINKTDSPTFSHIS